MSQSWRLRALALSCGLATLIAARTGAEIPPSPHAMLQPRTLVPGLLDAAPACLPDAEGDAFAGVIERARGGDAASARRKLAALKAKDSESLADGEFAVLDALLSLRAVSSAAAPTALRTAEAVLTTESSDQARACLLLERARVELRLGLLPEARLSLERARRAMDPRAMSGSTRETFRFYQAEAAARGERREEADTLFAELETSSNPTLAHAARLRRALAVENADDPAEVWKKLADLLTRAPDLGLDLDVWALPLAEAAIGAGRFEEARLWLVRAETRPEGGPLVSLRRADVLVELDRRDEARRLLERLAATEASAAVRSLAQMRLATAKLAPESERERRARLQKGAASPHPAVSVYAHAELAHRLTAAGEIDAALDQLVRVVYDGPSPLLTPHFQPDLDRVLAAIAASAANHEACPLVVRRLGGRRTLLLAHASAPAAFLGLGDCYLALGMAAAALDTYRATSARFALEVASALPLRLARASLQAGELPAVRAALRAERARLAEGSELAAAWQLVATELALAEGRGAVAAETLVPLLSSDALDPVQRAQALLDLALLALEGRGPDSLVETLHTELSETPAPAAGGSEALVAEASLYAADLAARDGSTKTARALYERAARGLPPGPLQARAAYRAGLLDGSLSGAREALASAADSEVESAWARLSRAELRLIRLRQEIGRPGNPAP